MKETSEQKMKRILTQEAIKLDSINTKLILIDGVLAFLSGQKGRWAWVMKGDLERIFGPGADEMVHVFLKDG